MTSSFNTLLDLGERSSPQRALGKQLPLEKARILACMFAWGTLVTLRKPVQGESPEP